MRLTVIGCSGSFAGPESAARVTSEGGPVTTSPSACTGPSTIVNAVAPNKARRETELFITPE